jgi:hypothetical protein
MPIQISKQIKLFIDGDKHCITLSFLSGAKNSQPEHRTWTAFVINSSVFIVKFPLHTKYRKTQRKLYVYSFILHSVYWISFCPHSDQILPKLSAPNFKEYAAELIHTLSCAVYCLYEVCALLGYYSAQNGSFVPTFRDNISVPTSKVKQSKSSAWP